jgi:hypothetical protein
LSRILPLSLLTIVLASGTAAAFDDLMNQPLNDGEPSPEPAPDSVPDHFADQRFHLETRLGLSTTVGLLGEVAEYNAADWLAVGGGLGINLDGPIWGVHARLRPITFASRSGRALHAITLEGAFSRGQYGSDPFGGLFSAMCEGNPDDPESSCFERTQRPEWISWAQGELGWEARFASHFTVRTSVGFATALNHPTWSCEHRGAPVACDGTAPPRTLFVESLALGYAF